MPIFNNALAGAAGSAGGAFEIERSLRFNSGDSADLTKTFSSAGNRRTWTFSAWIKFCDPAGTSGIFECTYPGSGGTISNTFEVWYTVGQIHITDYGTYYFSSDARLRDPSAWGHLVIRVDTTEATAANRIRLYWNGVQLVNSASGTISQNADLAVNNAALHKIGNWRNTTYANLYFAEIHHVDGQSLDPTSFGELDANTGVWNPIKYSGSHGTNGFHLDFSDNSSNAALGYDAAGSNNWTVNNLDHNEYTPFQKINALGTVTSANGYTLTNVVNAFDAATDFLGTTWSSSGTGNADTITWTPGSNITVPSGYNLYFAIYYKTTNNNNRFFRFTDASGSNGSEVAVSSSLITNGWTDVTSALPAAESNGDRIFSAFRYRDTVAYSGQYPRWYSVVIATSPPNSYNAPSNVTYLIDNSLGDPANSGCDSLLDSPTNYEASSGNNGGNYATLNPLATVSGLTLSDGNLDATGNVVQGCSLSTIFPSSGKYYAEFTLNTYHADTAVGVVSIDVDYNQDWVGEQAYTVGYLADGRLFQNSSSTNISAYAAGDTIGIAFDVDTGKIWFSKNGTFINSGNPGAGTGELKTITGGKPLGIAFRGVGAGAGSFNFGQRPFAYTPPTGFKSLCTQNLDDPLIANPSTEFDVLTWEGQSGSGSRDFRGLSFKPDLAWVKTRSQAYTHVLWDSVRGPGVNKELQTDSANQEGQANTSASGYIDAFVDGGFDTTAGTLDNDYFNRQSTTYVGWTWDGGDLATNSAYNQSAVWSNDLTATSSGAYFATGAGAADAFDGELNNSAQSEPNGSTITFSPTGGITVSTSLRVYRGSDSTSNTVNVSVNGGSSTTFARGQWVDLGFTGTLTSLAVSSPSANPGLSAIEVDGKILVDAGIIPAGSLNSSVYDQSQTWSNLVTGTLDTVYGNSSATAPFDGDTGSSYSDGIRPTNGNYLSMNFGTTFANATSVKIYGHASLDGVTYSGSEENLKINGTAIGASDWANNGGTAGQSSATFSLSNGLTSLEWGYASGSQSTGYLYLQGIEVDGKLLTNSGVTPTNVPSLASTVRANPTAGFSIVSYTGTGANASIAHNLNAVPEFAIFKARNGDNHWLVYHKSIGNDKKVNLNLADAQSSSSTSFFQSTDPTSSVFYLGTESSGNWSGYNMIGYLFSSVAGYSAFGSYTGNGSSDGPFVYTGFKTRWLMIKSSSNSGEDWLILDTARDTYNDGDSSALYASLSHADNSTSAITTDILSNGFKCIGTNAATNASGYTYIYAAFAENPFKTARAR